MKRLGSWLLYPFTVPWTLTVGYGWVLGACLIGLAEWSSLRFQGAAVLTARWRPKFAKRFGFSTTIGRGIIYDPMWYDETVAVDNRVEKHEFVHVAQIEDLMVLSFVVGLGIALVTGDWWLGLGVWWSGGGWQLPNFVTAVIRWGSKGLYKDTSHERHAYSETQEWSRLILPEDGRRSWADFRDEERERQKGVLR